MLQLNEIASTIEALKRKILMKISNKYLVLWVEDPSLILSYQTQAPTSWQFGTSAEYSS